MSAPRGIYVCTDCGHRWGSPTPPTICAYCDAPQPMIRSMTQDEWDDLELPEGRDINPAEQEEDF